MCRTAYYCHPLCGCRWLAVAQPCAPGMGFSTCPTFFTGKAKAAPRGFGTSNAVARAKLTKSPRDQHDSAAAVAAAFAWATIPCPVHTLGERYDRNTVRRIVDVRNGMRWGTGPSKDDFGVECSCSVM